VISPAVGDAGCAQQNNTARRSHAAQQRSRRRLWQLPFTTWHYVTFHIREFKVLNCETVFPFVTALI
jgi:hypothetical protein